MEHKSDHMRRNSSSNSKKIVEKMSHKAKIHKKTNLNNPSRLAPIQNKQKITPLTKNSPTSSRKCTYKLIQIQNPSRPTTRLRLLGITHRSTTLLRSRRTLTLRQTQKFVRLPAGNRKRLRNQGLTTQKNQSLTLTLMIFPLYFRII